MIINQFCRCFSALSPEHPFQLFTTICLLFLYPRLPKFLLFPLPLCSCPAILPFIHCPPTFVPQQDSPLLFSSALAQARSSTGSLEAPAIPIFLSSDQTYYSCSATRGMKMLAKAPLAHAQFLWQRCSCELIPYQSALVAPLKNTVEKFKLLSPDHVKIVSFQIQKSSTHLLTAGHGSTNNSQNFLCFLHIHTHGRNYFHTYTQPCKHG